MRIDYLRALYVPYLTQVNLSGRGFVDFKAWIASGRYQLEAASERDFTLRLNDQRSYAEMLGHDASRFSAASFETMNILNFPQTLPKSLGWVAVETYYSAFFAAHAIFRIFGNSFSFMAAGHLKYLDEIATALSMDWKMKKHPGSFLGLFDRSKQILTVSKAGSSHEDFWKEFYKLLDTLRYQVGQVSGLEPIKQKLMLDISAIMGSLTNSGQASSAAWLSQVRNSVNYQHSDGLWYPYSNRAHDAEKLKRLLKLWNSSTPMSLLETHCNSSIECFFRSCVAIVNFCYILIVDIESLAESNKSCFRQVPSALLRLAGRAAV